MRTLIFIFNFYGHVKAKSGPFKLGVEFVEKTVKFMVRPVSDDLIVVFMELLKFIDKKVIFINWYPIHFCSSNFYNSIRVNYKKN